MKLSTVLGRIRKASWRHWHHLEAYGRAFEFLDLDARRVVGGGADSIAVLLGDGRVFKMTTREITPEMGHRPFDLPILERGLRPWDGVTIGYYVQPLAQAASQTDLLRVAELIRGAGYHFCEPFIEQIGNYQGQPWLLDPFAVKAALQ
ncbi:MAG: hypothetical protein U0931_34965 [Vulcanimicrobiota bacterium]